MKTLKPLVCWFFLFVASQAYSQTQPTPYSQTDPSIQYFEIDEALSYQLPMKRGQGVLISSKTPFKLVNVEDKDGYEIILAPDQKFFSLTAQTNQSTTVWMVDQKDRVYSIKTKVSGHAKATVYHFVEPQTNSLTITKDANTPRFDAVTNTQFGEAVEFHPVNDRQYSYKGDDTLAPIALADNGQFTMLKFAGELPAIYRVDSKGKESIVNSHMHKGVLFVHGVYNQLTARLGDRTVCIFRGGE